MALRKILAAGARFRLGCAALILTGFVPSAFAQSVPVSGSPSYVWIFSGVLPTTLETLSGTLVASAARSEFELRLGDSITCQGSRLDNETGIVRLQALTCGDGRLMRASFVASGGTDLRVFGSIGGDEFIVDAHLLDFDKPDDGTARGLWPPALPPVPVAPVSAP